MKKSIRKFLLDRVKIPNSKMVNNKIDVQYFISLSSILGEYVTLYTTREEQDKIEAHTHAEDCVRVDTTK